VDWIAWQLCDSAFPAGGLAHSGGLEAAWQAGAVRSPAELEQWLDAALRQAAHGAVPLVAAAWDVDASKVPFDSRSQPDSRSLAELDAICDAFLLNHVANRASRAQGQALLMACARTFEDVAGVRQVTDEMARAVRDGPMAGHYPVVFGVICKALGLPARRACEMFLFLALRGAVSSAVRLGIVGPLQGQKLQRKLVGLAGALVDRCIDTPADDIVQTAPIADLLQATQDRLYSRLFVS